mgnify:CR=1 FL=1
MLRKPYAKFKFFERRIHMNIRWALFALACVAPLAWAEVPAKLFYTSQTDFTDITLTLKKAQALHPEFIEVDVTLTPQAQERTKALSQAAMHDMGIALIPPFLIQRELGEKQLVIANQQALTSSKAYYLMIPERKAESAALLAFRDWLLKAAGEYRQG